MESRLCKFSYKLIFEFFTPLKSSDGAPLLPQMQCRSVAPLRSGSTTPLVIGVIHGIQLAFENMGVNNGGQGGFIINTASNTGFVSFPLGPVYCATKHGVVGLTKSYGSEFHLVRTGVTVNAICPGPTETAMYQAFPQISVCEKTAKELMSSLTTIDPSKLGHALIQLLQDGKNGALLEVDSDGARYVPSSVNYYDNIS